MHVFFKGIELNILNFSFSVKGEKMSIIEKNNNLSSIYFSPFLGQPNNTLFMK